MITVADTIGTEQNEMKFLKYTSTVLVVRMRFLSIHNFPQYFETSPRKCRKFLNKYDCKT